MPEFSFSFTGTMADWQDFVRHAAGTNRVVSDVVSGTLPEVTERTAVSLSALADQIDAQGSVGGASEDKPKRVRRTKAQIEADEAAAKAEAAGAAKVEDAQVVELEPEPEPEPDDALAALMGAGAPDETVAAPTPTWPEFTSQFGNHVRSGKLASDAANELVKRLGIPSLTPLMTDEALRAKAVGVINDMIAGK